MAQKRIRSVNTRAGKKELPIDAFLRRRGLKEIDPDMFDWEVAQRVARARGWAGAELVDIIPKKVTMTPCRRPPLPPESK